MSETRATVPDNHRGSPCFGGSAPHPCLWSVAHGSFKESSSLGNSANGVVWRGRYTRPSWALCLRLGLLTLGLRESLTDRCRAGDDFWWPHAHVPAEARQGDARLSCFNSHALHRCPCHGLLNATPPPTHTHTFLCFLLATSRCRMAPGTGPQGREVAACPAEMLRVSDKHPSGMPHSAVGHELHCHEATTRIFKRCLQTETPVKRGYPLIA